MLFRSGSDFPIESINPILGFYAAIARKDVNGNPPEGFNIENALSREEAMKAMTIWAAKACFEEDIKGSIERDKFADFVILDGDIMEMDIRQVANVKVLQTYIAGAQVYACK